MKHLIKYFIATFLLSFSFFALPINNASAQGAEVNFQIFYDQLSPYGHWVDFPDEGYIWIPDNQSGFAPYQTNGYWAYTDYGWTWVSDYPWGWATFHYGRWDFDDDYGWYWVPEYEWAPAWVAWSREPGYYGWAPLRPEIDVNASITSGYYAPPEHWSYVHDGDLGRRDIDRHYIPRSENATHIRNSQMINKTFIDQERHTTYAGGPPREEVEKATKAPIQQLALVQRSTPGQTVAANKISIYKPVVAQKTGSEPPPSKLASIRDIKPLPGRTPSQARLNAAPRTAPAQQTEQRANPVNPSTPPPARQNERINTQSAPEPNRNAPPPQQRQQPAPQAQQQPPPQQNAPRENPQMNLQQQPRQQQPSAQPAQRQMQQSNPQRIQRENRFAAPTYQAPKPSATPPQAQPHPGAQLRQAPQSMQQPHAAPPQQQPHGQPPGQQKQDGKPH